MTNASTSPPPQAHDTPESGDFELKAKVLKKENFGSAGSNITYRIEADAAARWLVAMRSAR